MEAVDNQSARPAPEIESSNLRYPWRSTPKPKNEKSPIAGPTVSSASRRGRLSPAVSRSVSVFSVSGKDSTAKPPRRLSNPTKPGASPLPASVGNITPISDIRAKRLNMQEKSDSPFSEVSKSAIRQKFNVLSSVSYWLTQIKLSESASRHSISLGFFKLALESGCEPSDRIREELKSYIQRHNLVAEQEESVKDLLQCYNIREDLEKLKFSETSVKSPKEMARKSDKGRCSFASDAKYRSSTCKSLNSDSFSAIANSNIKDSFQKRQPKSTNKYLDNRNTTKVVGNNDIISASTQRKSQKSRTEIVGGNEKMEASSDNYPTESAKFSPTEDALQENKENMGIHAVEEAGSAEELQVN